MTLLPDHEIHGTLVSLSGRGLLLCGPAASGKSSLAWKLIEHGHQLVVDDSPVYERRGNALIGSCRAGFEGLLYLPDQGLIDVRKYRGEQAWLPEIAIDWVVRLDPATSAGGSGKITGVWDRISLFNIQLPCLRLNPALARASNSNISPR